MGTRNREPPNRRDAKLNVSRKPKRIVELFKKIRNKQMGIMESEEKSKKLMRLLVLACILAATLGGCVISLNIQNKNNNSDQKVEQNARANQENDSTTFNLKTN